MHGEINRVNTVLGKNLIVLQPHWPQPAVSAAAESGTAMHHRKPAKSSKKKSYDEALSSLAATLPVVHSKKAQYIYIGTVSS